MVRDRTRSLKQLMTIESLDMILCHPENTSSVASVGIGILELTSNHVQCFNGQ